MNEQEKLFFNNYQKQSDDIVAVNTFLYLISEDFIKLKSNLAQQIELNQAQVDTIVSAIENGEAEKLTSGRFALDKVTENFKEDHATCQAILKEPIQALNMVKSSEDGGEYSTP